METIFNSTTTSVSLFFTNKIYHPNLLVYPKRDLSSARAKDDAADLDSLHQFLQGKVVNAQVCYQGPADVYWLLAHDFKVGDPVYVCQGQVL